MTATAGLVRDTRAFCEARKPFRELVRFLGVEVSSTGRRRKLAKVRVGAEQQSNVFSEQPRPEA